MNSSDCLYCGHFADPRDGDIEVVAAGTARGWAHKGCHYQHEEDRWDAEVAKALAFLGCEL